RRGGGGGGGGAGGGRGGDRGGGGEARLPPRAARGVARGSLPFVADGTAASGRRVGGQVRSAAAPRSKPRPERLPAGQPEAARRRTHPHAARHHGRDPVAGSEERATRSSGEDGRLRRIRRAVVLGRR